MKTRVAIALLACVVAFTLASGATGTLAAKQQTACGPKVSLLLWPKGYKAYPLPDFEVFSGLSGPYGVSNILAYAAAAKDGALGYPSANVSPACVDYSTPSRLSPLPLSASIRTAVRFACTYPKSPIVTINMLPALAKRIRVILPSGTVVADATVTAHGSSLRYATKYCTKKLSLIAPSS